MSIDQMIVDLVKGYVQGAPCGFVQIKELLARIAKGITLANVSSPDFKIPARKAENVAELRELLVKLGFRDEQPADCSKS